MTPPTSSDIEAKIVANELENAYYFCLAFPIRSNW